jgi:tetratricopeptide (TPR) repeat protein
MNSTENARQRNSSFRMRTSGKAVANALGSGIQINFGHPSDRLRPAAVVETIEPHDHAVFDEFIGRRAEVTALTANLRPTLNKDAAVVSVISGLAGIGKTSLARHVASQTAQTWFPGGAVFVDLHGYEQNSRVNAEQLFGPILYALGLKPSDIPDSAAQQGAVFHHQMALLARDGRRVLLILDNVSETNQVSGLLPRQRIHRAVLTSRDRLGDLHDATYIALPELTQEEAIALVDSALQRRNPDDCRISQQYSAAAELVSLCGYLPLALQISASLLAEEPGRDLEDIVAELSDSHTRLEGLTYGQHGVQSAFNLSYRNLGKKQAQVFRLLAIHPGPHFSSEATAELTGDSVFSTRRLLAELARAHLIEHDAALNRWRLHDLVYIYVRQLSGDGPLKDEVDSAFRRLLQYYVETACAADCVLRGRTDVESRVRFAGTQEALEWFDTERPSLIATIGLAEISNLPDVAMRLSLAMAGYYNWRHEPSELLSMTLTASAASSGIPSRYIGPDDLDRLGYVYQQSGFLEEAIVNYQKAISLYRAHKHLRGLARSLRNFGMALMEVQKPNDAIAALSEAADLYHSMQEMHEEASALTNLGNALRQEQLLEKAISVLRRASELHKESSDVPGEAAALTNLGAALVEFARFDAEHTTLDEAAVILSRAAELYQNGRDRRGEASALTNLGGVLRKLGKFDDASFVLHQAAALYGEMGDRSGQAAAFTNFGSVLAKQGRVREAISILNQAISLYSRAGDRHGQAGALTNLGMLLARDGEAAEATSRLGEAALLYNQDRDFERERRALNMIKKIRK